MSASPRLLEAHILLFYTVAQCVVRVNLKIYMA